MNRIGDKILNLIKKLYPINRSLTGPGNLETLKMIKNIIPNLKIFKFKSGKKVFDWTIPPEWSVKSAYIIGIVILALIFYLLTSVLIKAFKISDINLRY